MIRDRLAITEATAMIGTASWGPNSYTSTGTSMIEEPVPTMPLMVPATSPTASTKTKFKDLRLRESAWLGILSNTPMAAKLNGDLPPAQGRLSVATSAADTALAAAAG